VGTSGQLEELSDADLVLRARTAPAEEERDAAFMAIYDRHLKDLTWYCRAELRQLRQIDRAEDAIQDAFLAAYKELCLKKTPVIELGAWLRGIARNRCFLYMRGGRPGKGHRAGPEMLLSSDQDSGDLPDTDTDVEDAAVKAALQVDAERLVAMVAATLTERQQRIYELSIRGQLGGQARGERLGVSAAQASRLKNEIANLVMKGVGALVLAQAGRAYCPVLAGILDQAAWNGENFDARLRARIVRHFDTCTVCDNCSVCATKQQELGEQLIPVLIPILFAGILRERIADATRQVGSSAHSSSKPPGDIPPTPPPPGGGRMPRLTRRILHGRPPATDPPTRPGLRRTPGPLKRHSRRLFTKSPGLTTGVVIAAVVGIGGGIAVPFIVGGQSHLTSPRPHATDTSATAQTAAVHACSVRTFPTPPGTSPTPTPSVPAVVRLPGSVRLPNGSEVFGGLPGANSTSPDYLIGPSPGACQLVGESADSGEYVTVTQPGSTVPSIGETLSPGGFAINAGMACTYIPQTASIPGISGGSSLGCSSQPGEVITPLPTGSQALYASLVRIPASTRDNFIASSGHGYTSFAAFVVRIGLQNGQLTNTDVSEVDCALPAARENTCRASLAYFIVSYSSGQGIKKRPPCGDGTEN
jgi:RNA polymerase sigma factor (sigma-70 family)